MKQTTYAQNLEDVVLDRAFKNIKNGFYIDIGAADPTKDSVTKLFYDKGWSGINIEPQNYYFQKLATDRGRDVNLNIGIANSKETKTFYEFPKFRGWSSFDPSVKQKLQNFEVIEKKVEVIPLSEVIEVYVPKNQVVHFLKIDVEGYEKQVLESINLSVFRPIVIVIEITRGSSWENLIENSGYVLSLKDGINYFYVRKESKEITDIIKLIKAKNA
jgi:FkbM family methyltransferase